MNRTLRFAKRFGLPAFLVGMLLVLAQVVFAQPPLVPDFGVTPAAGSNCGTWTFTSNATDPDGDIAATNWTFGDGGNGNGSPVQHAYTTPGTYPVNESVTDAAGGDDLTEDTVNAPTQNVTVINSGQPTANVGATPNPAQLNATVTFDAAGSVDNGTGGAITKYEWDLDGNTGNGYETDTGTTPTATAQFATGGSHTVRLRVTDNCGAQAVDSVSVFVQNTPPSASFTSTPTPGKVNQAISFDASASADTGGTIASYHWSWGDGTADTVSTNPVTPHTFATSGQHFVQLFVTDNDNATSPVVGKLVRVNAPPTANFVASANPSLIGEEVTFTPTGSTDSDGTIATYQWDFDGNGTVDATSLPAAPAVKHTYGTPSDMNVKLTVTDNDGDTGNVTRTQTVQATRPSPGFSFSPANPIPGQTVTLSSNSAPSTAAGHAITDTQWDFAYSPLTDFHLAKRGKSVTTAFATAGPHTVGLKVVETGGGFAVAYRTITVNAPPRASFTVLPSKPVEGQGITFASTSSDAEGPIAKLAWDLDGDSKYDDGGAAVITTKKLKKGTHNVHLRVTDGKGATAVATVPVTVGRRPLDDAPDTDRTLGFAPRAWGIKVVALYVHVPSRTTVRVRCSGHGCPSGKFLKRSGKRTTVLRFKGFQGNLRSGTKITVISWRPNSLAEYFTYKVRGGYKSPLKQKRCKALTAKKYRSCG